MHLRIEDYAPAPADDFICYPGQLPEGSFVYFESGLLELSEQSPLQDATATLHRLNSTPLDERIAVLAHGTNANPAQIAKKMANLDSDRTVPFLLGDVKELTPIYAGHIAAYGAIPATLDAVAGEQNKIFLAFFTQPQLKAIVNSEHGNYVLCSSGQAQIYLPGLDKPIPFYAFVSHKGILVLNGEPVTLTSMTEGEVIHALLRKIEGEEGVPSFDDYSKDPLPYRTAVEKAIDKLGLWRKHKENWQEMQLSEL